MPRMPHYTPISVTDLLDTLAEGLSSGHWGQPKLQVLGEGFKAYGVEEITRLP